MRSSSQGSLIYCHKGNSTSPLHSPQYSPGHYSTALPPHVPIVPISVKAPVTASMLYIETLFESKFAT